MQIKATMAPGGSPVPGVIPEPVRVREDAPAARERLLTGRPAAGTAASGRRNLSRRTLGALLSALRGEKHMVGAYPLEWQAPDERGTP